MRLYRYALPVGLAFATLAAPAISFAQLSINVSVNLGPPELPVYEQPVIPAEGYLWTPGYWAYAEDAGYYWVPGTWVEPPQPGLLWTPGYWAFNDGAYVFNAGYWGPEVGFYGGVDYGFGYTGDGYYGGRWDHDRFLYNTTVNHINTTIIKNVYNEPVHVEHETRVSFNGGNGGITARPTAKQETFAHEHHVAPTPMQVEHVKAASADPALRASENHGKPAIAATEKPGDFKGKGVVAAREGGKVPEGKPMPVQAGKNGPERGGNGRAGTTPGNDRRAAEPNGAHAGSERTGSERAGTEQTGTEPGTERHVAEPNGARPGTERAATPPGNDHRVAEPNQREVPERHAVQPTEHPTGVTEEHNKAPEPEHSATLPRQHAPDQQAEHPPERPAASPDQHRTVEPEHSVTPPHPQAERAAPRAEGGQAMRPQGEPHPAATPHPEAAAHPAAPHAAEKKPEEEKRP
jgi:hypothetical protein